MYLCRWKLGKQEAMKNIIFDLGGVVVDWSPARVVQEYPGDAALPVALFEDGFFERNWQDFDRGVVTQTEIVKEMCRFTGRDYAECWDFIEFIKHSLRDIPATCQLIRELSAQGHRLFCLSNMSFEFYDYMKDREVFTYFEGQVISAYEKVIKPEKEIYRILTDRFGLQPQESLFVDDLARNTEAARQLGFHTVQFTNRTEGVRLVREWVEQ